MGFLSKMKSNLTGDWAKVTLAVTEAPRGGVLDATVDILVKDTEISVDGVIVEIHCEEIVDFPRHRLNSSESGSYTGDLTETSTLHEQTVNLAGPQQLAAGSPHTLTGQIPVPANMPPSFNGRHARVQWSVRARIEMKGNDPDSGWQTLNVQ